MSHGYNADGVDIDLRIDESGEEWHPDLNQPLRSLASHRRAFIVGYVWGAVTAFVLWAIFRLLT